jgi:hypothetical protein
MEDFVAYVELNISDKDDAWAAWLVPNVQTPVPALSPDIS